MAELANLPAPTGPQPIDGLSLLPVLKDPAARIRDHAYHAYPIGKLGRALRTERYRLVEWKKPGTPQASAEYELYDYMTDPDEAKNHYTDLPDIARKLKETLAKYPKPAKR